MFTITTQGSFVSDALPRIILAPQGIDWFRVTNWTNISGQTNDSATEFIWYRGMAINDALVTYWNANHTALLAARTRAAGNVLGATASGFTLMDSTTQLPAKQGTTVTSTAAAAPIVQVTAAGPGELATANIIAFQTVVRMNYVAAIGAAPSIMGIDYTATAKDATHFTLPVHANAIPAAGAGVFTIVSYNIDPMFYPMNRTAINVTRAAQAVVTTSVMPSYTVGQKLRMKVPLVCGMKELNDVEVTVVANYASDPLVLLPNEFRIDIDTTGFTAFTWPLLANYQYQVAEVIPVGQEAKQPYVQSYLDATNNVGYSGMLLGNGTDAATNLLSPAGTAADIMYWQAGKVENL